LDRASLELFQATACGRLPVRGAHGFDWKSLHGQHVERLRAAWSGILKGLGLGAVVIHSGKQNLKYSRDDQYWPPVLTPHFNHWLPYEETQALLVFQIDSMPRLYTKRHDSFWDSPGSQNPFWNPTSFRTEQVIDLAAVQLPPLATYIGDDLQLAAALGLSSDQCNRDDVLTAADFLRTLKSEFEVACILIANETAACGHASLRDKFSQGPVSELDLQLLYLANTRQTDFTLPYGSIVAVGANAGVLHHVNYEGSAKTGDLSLLVDAGAKFNGYASDITRTWVRGDGKAASEFRSLIKKVDQLQQRLVADVKIGKQYEELHNAGHQYIADALIGAGVIKCSREMAVENGLTRVFFPHGLGHSLGLQVHDVGMKLKAPATNNKYLRNTSAISQGQVLTIEPGIYFIPSLLKGAFQSEHGKFLDRDRIDLLAPFGGIRIEDNILATQQGPINLSAASPRLNG
jgi:Xaa-Pro dipeptidase